MKGLLQHKVVLVTGAGQGNGQAIALGLARAGACVVATDLDGHAARRTAELIQQENGTAWSWPLDVTDAQQCQDLATTVERACGAVDVLVNNAGIIIREGSDSPHALRNWDRTLQVNLQGVFNVTMALRPQLWRQQASVINIASIAAFAGQGGSLGYSPSKAAVVMLTQSWAAEWAVHGVRVNALAPGVIATPMTADTRAQPRKLQAFMARTPMGRVGLPQELVGPVLFLASPMSSYVTGVTLPVDGGFLAT
jgi:NAD(P)-dependent dehydrogenase (short-subunit alcohol dehydrogenase family)